MNEGQIDTVGLAGLRGSRRSASRSLGWKRNPQSVGRSPVGSYPENQRKKVVFSSSPWAGFGFRASGFYPSSDLWIGREEEKRGSEYRGERWSFRLYIPTTRVYKLIGWAQSSRARVSTINRRRSSRFGGTFFFVPLEMKSRFRRKRNSSSALHPFILRFSRNA